MTRARFEDRLFGVLRWVVIAGLLLATAFPFYYMVMLSLRPTGELLLHPGALWPQLREITVGTYRNILTPTSSGGQGLLGMLGNSALVSLVTVALTLAASVPGAWAISRLKFAGSRQISALFLAVYLFPATLLAVPLFVMFSRIGLQGSLLGLAVVYIAQTVPVSIYMLRNYFSTVPVSIEEAAALDGCSRPAILRRVVLPLAAPSLMATGLYVFMISWNEFLFASLFLTATPDKWTVSLGLKLMNNAIQVPPTELMAGSVVLTVPVIVVFYAAQRFLTEGLTSGADKS